MRLTATETDIHVACLEILALYLPDSAVSWHTPNGGQRSARAGAAMKRLGTLPGFPDLAVLYGGDLFLFEIKRPGGRRSKEQVELADRLARAGSPVMLIKSPEELRDWLVRLGLVRGGRA